MAADDDEFETPTYGTVEMPEPPPDLPDIFTPTTEAPPAPPAAREPVWEVKFSFGPRQPALMAQYEALGQTDLTARLLNQPDGPDKEHMLQVWLDKEYLNLSMSPDALDRLDIARAIKAKANRYAAYLQPQGTALPVESAMPAALDDMEITFDDEVLDTGPQEGEPEAEAEEAPEPAGDEATYPEGAHVFWNLTDGSILAGLVEGAPAEPAADDPEGGPVYTINCDDEYLAHPGGVPLGRIEHVGEAYLELMDAEADAVAEADTEVEPAPPAEVAEEDAPAPAVEVPALPNPTPAAAKTGKPMSQSTKYKYDASAEPYVPGQATINVRLMIEPLTPDGKRRAVISINSHDLPPIVKVSEFNDLLCSALPQLVAQYDAKLPERAKEATVKPGGKMRKDGVTPTSSVAAKPKPGPKFGESGHLPAAPAGEAPEPAPIRPAPKPTPKPKKGAAAKKATPAKPAKVAKPPSKGGQISFD